MVPDGVTFSCSTQRGNRADSSNADFDFQLVEGIPKEGSIDDCEWITESCKKDRGWWQEALNFADHIERMRQLPESCNKVRPCFQGSFFFLFIFMYGIVKCVQ